ncbi:MAG TPA: hypothetical protein VJX66_18970 [Amycolatopsis sp.]|nr:hypothetical protein [Amycolatopsis sp.]
MNNMLIHRARISLFAGAATILVGLTASACGSSPAPASPATTTPVPASTATPGTQPAAPATASARPSKPGGPDPVLGTVWGPGQQGYGTARPATIFNGGDPTGLVTGVHWQSWGGPVAIGTGMSSDARNTDVANAQQRKATIQAFNLGVCKGKLMYQAIEWYFPGDKFDPHKYIDICTGKYVGS